MAMTSNIEGRLTARLPPCCHRDQGVAGRRGERRGWALSGNPVPDTTGPRGFGMGRRGMSETAPIPRGVCSVSASAAYHVLG